MKLRNKETSEIGYFCFANWDNPVLTIMDKNGIQFAKYNSLAELNAEWEDVPEEPKKYYFIDPCGEVVPFWEDEETPEDTEASKQIGDYFETKEEAELTVRKLKAWKRLKDKGLNFCAWKITDDGCSVDIETTLDAEVVRAQQKYITDDLDLLFGGEE